MNDKPIGYYHGTAVYRNQFGMFYAYIRIQEGWTSYFDKVAADTLDGLKQMLSKEVA